MMGPFLLGAHVFTMWIWLFFRVWQTLDVHCGYDFPLSLNRWLPLWGGADFHDYHHMSFTGNYASTFTLWDKVFGTDTKFWDWKKKTETTKSD
jgi:methylsterol monooxygenase